jgi:hypothetical protein
VSPVGITVGVMAPRPRRGHGRARRGEPRGGTQPEVGEVGAQLLVDGGRRGPARRGGGVRGAGRWGPHPRRGARRGRREASTPGNATARGSDPGLRPGRRPARARSSQGGGPPCSTMSPEHRRHGYNVLRQPDGRPGIIDGGLALPRGSDNEIRSCFFPQVVGRRRDRSVIAAVRGIDESLLVSRLQKTGISVEAIDGVLARLTKFRAV